MRNHRKGVAAVLPLTAGVAIAGCGSTVKHIAEHEIGYTQIKTASTPAAGDVAVMTRFAADSRGFVGGTGKLLLAFQSRSPGTKSAVYRKVESLIALGEDEQHADASLHDSKIRKEIAPVVASVGAETADLKQLAIAMTSNNGHLGDTALVKLRRDFIKEHSLAIKLQAHGLTP
jgi:hypothetical protein